MKRTAEFKTNGCRQQTRHPADKAGKRKEGQNSAHIRKNNFNPEGLLQNVQIPGMAF